MHRQPSPERGEGDPRKGHLGLRADKPMKVVVLDHYHDYGCLSLEHLCGFLGITSGVLHAWKRRGPSQRQGTDLVTLASIGEQHRSCLGTCGRICMTQEFKEEGIKVGERRVGRLIAETDIRVDRKPKDKATTHSMHSLGVASDLLDGDFTGTDPNQK